MSIGWGVDLLGETVTLLIAVVPLTDGQISVRVQVRPALEETYLPANLILSLCSETGAVLRKVQSQISDNYI